MEQLNLFDEPKVITSKPKLEIIKSSYELCNSLDDFINKLIHKSVDDDLIVNVNAKLKSKESTRQLYDIEYSYLDKENLDKENKAENTTYQHFVNFTESIVLEPNEYISDEIRIRILYLKDRIKKKEIKTEVIGNRLKIYSPKKEIKRILNIK